MTISTIVVMAAEDLYRDKERRLHRVAKGQQCNIKHYSTTTTMGELLIEIEKQWRIPSQSIHFEFCGEKLSSDDNFHKLGMKNNDIVEVFHSPSWSLVSHSTLIVDVKNMKAMTQYADFTVKVGKKIYSSSSSSLDGDFSNDDYKEFHLHKLVLSTRSPKFHSMFRSEMDESKLGYVEIENYSPKIFEYFINYLYSDDIHFSDLCVQDVLSLLALSDEFLVSRLKQFCELELCKHVKVENVIDFLQAADLHQANQLKSYCQRICLAHFDKIKEQQKRRLSQDLLIQLTSTAIVSFNSLKKKTSTQIG